MKFEKVLAERNNKVIYKNGNLAIKVFDENFAKSDVLNEALNQARVEETGLFRTLFDISVKIIFTRIKF